MRLMITLGGKGKVKKNKKAHKVAHKCCAHVCEISLDFTVNILFY